MRARVLALVGFMAVSAAFAKDASPDNIKGLYLTTDFPVVQLRAGEETSLPITIYNYGLKPQRTAIKLTGAPADWKPSLEGSGKPASAAFVDYDGRDWHPHPGLSPSPSERYGQAMTFDRARGVAVLFGLGGCEDRPCFVGIKTIDKLCGTLALDPWANLACLVATTIVFWRNTRPKDTASSRSIACTSHEGSRQVPSGSSS